MRELLRDRVFFVAMAAAIVVTVFVGFAPTFYLRFLAHPTAGLPFYLGIHGAAFTAWIILFAAQVALVASGQTPRHRRLGWVGAVLATAMVASGTTAGILSMRREFAAGYEEEAAAFLLTPFSAMLVFATLVAAAYIWGGSVVVAGQALRLLGGTTEMWRAVARQMLQ